MSEKPLYAADDFAEIAAKLRTLEAQREIDKTDAMMMNAFNFALQCGNHECGFTWQAPSYAIKWKCRQCGSAGAIKWHMPHNSNGDWIAGEPSSW